MHNARAPRKSRSTCLTHLEFMVLASPRHHRRVTAGAEVAAKPFPTRESNKIRGATCSNVILYPLNTVPNKGSDRYSVLSARCPGTPNVILIAATLDFF